jgi:hypothetical protein
MESEFGIEEFLNFVESPEQSIIIIHQSSDSSLIINH